jgi:hypothetical protein
MVSRQDKLRWSGNRRLMIYGYSIWMALTLPLGIIPIRADNTCIWGCIDIDQYPFDHKGLVEKLRS